jgi:uncharacterized membrane protein
MFAHFNSLATKLGFAQIGIIGSKTNHLATLAETDPSNWPQPSPAGRILHLNKDLVHVDHKHMIGWNHLKGIQSLTSEGIVFSVKADFGTTFFRLTSFRLMTFCLNVVLPKIQKHCLA